MNNCVFKGYLLKTHSFIYHKKAGFIILI